ncbi:glycosyltransferase domain-containing protein [Agrococcus sp. Marseille-Q4369]|uniref:glycosyltransferase domain-containing protein n=1 Tax=Agrococcus sp. Marseille-Q4369 TaxID=2810513 RepID=UPI001B8D24FE|nr:glycosyltransferase domain-containing protein [Agrococcus sp. Marseille-Q4369]QUW18562.1 DUF616 domain-containing protein [Agrococcus sp. Marseille-Q4369]
MATRRAVYTVLMGGYEQLNHDSARSDSGIDFVCLTDDPALRSPTWTVVPVEPALPADPVRSQRMLKIVGHPALDEYEETLYVDNAVQLLGDAHSILDDWLGEHDLAMHAHSYRERVVDEFDEVLALRYDDGVRIHEQLMHYAATAPEALADRPLWTAMLARRHTPAVAGAMRTWCDHVLRYSRRDQLSVTVALRSHGLHPRVIEADNFGSAIHRWPMDVGRRVEQGKASARPAGPLIAEIARLERRVAAAERDAAELVELRERLAGLDDQVSAARADAAQAHEDELEARAALERATELARQRGDEVAQLRASTSWKLTSPARLAGRLLRGR